MNQIALQSLLLPPKHLFLSYKAEAATQLQSVTVDNTCEKISEKCCKLLKITISHAFYIQV